MHRNNLYRAASGCVLLAAVCVCTLPAFGQAQPAQPLVRYYYKQPVELTVDPSRIAVFIEGDVDSQAARNAMAQRGMAAADVQQHALPSWSFVSTPHAARGAAGASAFASQVLADGVVHFATPVFLDESGKPMLPSPDVIVRFAPHVGRNAALNVLRQFHPQPEENWNEMSNVYHLPNVARHGYDVINVANALATHGDVLWAEVDWVVTVEPLGGVFPNDPAFPNCWGHNNTGQNVSCGDCLGWPIVPGIVDRDMDTVEAWEITTGSPSIVVAVFDNGVTQNPRTSTRSRRATTSSTSAATAARGPAAMDTAPPWPAPSRPS